MKKFQVLFHSLRTAWLIWIYWDQRKIQYNVWDEKKRKFGQNLTEILQKQKKKQADLIFKYAKPWLKIEVW